MKMHQAILELFCEDASSHSRIVLHTHIHAGLHTESGAWGEGGGGGQTVTFQIVGGEGAVV